MPARHRNRARRHQPDHGELQFLLDATPPPGNLRSDTRTAPAAAQVARRPPPAEAGARRRRERHHVQNSRTRIERPPPRQELQARHTYRRRRQRDRGSSWTRDRARPPHPARGCRAHEPPRASLAARRVRSNATPNAVVTPMAHSTTTATTPTPRGRGTASPCRRRAARRAVQIASMFRVSGSSNPTATSSRLSSETRRARGFRPRAARPAAPDTEARVTSSTKATTTIAIATGSNTPCARVRRTSSRTGARSGQGRHSQNGAFAIQLPRAGAVLADREQDQAEAAHADHGDRDLALLDATRWIHRSQSASRVRPPAPRSSGSRARAPSATTRAAEIRGVGEAPRVRKRQQRYARPGARASRTARLLRGHQIRQRAARGERRRDHARRAERSSFAPAPYTTRNQQHAAHRRQRPQTGLAITRTPAPIPTRGSSRAGEWTRSGGSVRASCPARNARGRAVLPSSNQNP